MALINQNYDLGKYIDPLSDWGWKTLFGSERYKEHLISFINAVYPDLGITDITYENVEDQGDTAFSRNSRFDLICQTDKSESVMVEVQKAEQEYFFERGLWTTSFKIRDQAPKGKWDYHLKGVYSIGILTFPPGKIEGFDWDDNSYIHSFSLREDESFKRMTDLLRFTYIATDKFKKTPGELENILEKWVYLLTNLKRLDGRPEELRDRIFERFFKAAEIARLPKEQQQNYRRKVMSENDWENALEFAEKKGRKAGMEDGMEAGRKAGMEAGMEAGKKTIAKNLLSEGFPANQVAKWTGLSESEIAELAR